MSAPAEEERCEHVGEREARDGGGRFGIGVLLVRAARPHWIPVRGTRRGSAGPTERSRSGSGCEGLRGCSRLYDLQGGQDKVQPPEDQIEVVIDFLHDQKGYRRLFDGLRPEHAAVGKD